MQLLSNYGSSVQSSYIVGHTNVEQKVIDETLSYLNKTLLPHYSAHIKNKTDFGDYSNWSKTLHKIKYPFPGSFTIPPYLSDSKLKGIRYWASMTYNVSKLNFSNPVEHLLILLSERITDLGFFGFDDIDMRFEKGCFYPITKTWHQDGCDAISCCFSNVADWNTKILDDSAVNELGGIPTSTYSMEEKIESLATSAEFGVFYNVMKVLHRSPVNSDFTTHVSEEDYRIFIRFTNYSVRANDNFPPK